MSCTNLDEQRRVMFAYVSAPMLRVALYDTEVVG